MCIQCLLFYPRMQYFMLIKIFYLHLKLDLRKPWLVHILFKPMESFSVMIWICLAYQYQEIFLIVWWFLQWLLLYLYHIHQIYLDWHLLTPRNNDMLLHIENEIHHKISSNYCVCFGARVLMSVRCNSNEIWFHPTKICLLK